MKFFISIVLALLCVASAEGSEIIHEKLEKVEESIDQLIVGIWNSPVIHQEYKPIKDEIEGIKPAPAREVESEIVKQRLSAIKRSITNIETALAETGGRIGENCGWVSVCTFAVCTEYGLPENSPIATSGGTPVCLKAECRAWEDRFVCK